MQAIEDKLDKLLKNQQEVTDRLSRLELSHNNAQNLGDDSGEGVQDDQDGNEGAAGGPTSIAEGAATIPSGLDLERNFDTIKETLKSVKLPNHLRVFDYKTGITADCQATNAVIGKCARYTETGLKWCAMMRHKLASGETIDLADIDIIQQVLQAEVNFLQGKFSTLIVKSSFDKDVSKFYELLNKGNSAFDDQSIRHLQAAVELQNARTRQNTVQPQVQRGRGRGGYGQYRFGQNRGRDVFNQFSQRGFPQRRPYNQGVSGGNTYNQDNSDQASY